MSIYKSKSIFELFSIMGYITKKNAIFERNIY